MKSVFVAGAASPGIGEAITRLLLDHSMTVVGTYDIEDAEGAAKLLSDYPTNLILHSVDHSSMDDLLALANTIEGPLAGYVHAQMFFHIEQFENFDYSAWTKSLAVNLSAPNLLAHELQPHLDQGASIVFVTSTEAFIGSFGASAYSATKAAIHNLIKSLANNLGPRNIRVNAVAPGWIGGVMDTDEVFNLSREITPLGRLGSATEVANVVEFLLSEKSSFVNGTTIIVDGGYTGVDTISKFEAKTSTPNQ